jgi:hypothetical protein
LKFIDLKISFILQKDVGNYFIFKNCFYNLCPKGLNFRGRKKTYLKETEGEIISNFAEAMKKELCERIVFNTGKF